MRPVAKIAMARRERATARWPPPGAASCRPDGEADADKTDAQLRKIIMEGRSGTAMTGYAASLNEAQIADLLAYIRSLQP